MCLKVSQLPDPIEAYAYGHHCPWIPEAACFCSPCVQKLAGSMLLLGGPCLAPHPTL